MDELYRLVGLLEKGGFVGPPLVVGALVLWFAMGYRFVLLYAIDRRPVRELIEAARQGSLTKPRGVIAQAVVDAVALSRRSLPNLRYHIDELLFGHVASLGRLGGIASGIVKIAPLLGLLGTVSGMIDTFDSLGDVTSGANQGTGVAGGISEALFSTQMGLLVAIPGLLLGRLLDRRQTLIEEEFEKLKDVVAT